MPSPWLEQRGAAGNQAHHLVDRVRVLQVAEQQRLLFGSRDVVRAGPVLEQQLDGDPIRVGNIGVPLVERVVESQATLVDQRQHDRRRERLRHAAHTEHLVGGHRLPGGRVRHPARQQHVVVAGHADRHGGARHAGGGHQCVELRLQLVGDCGRVHRHGVVDGFRLGLGRRRLHRRLHALGGREDVATGGEVPAASSRTGVAGSVHATGSATRATNAATATRGKEFIHRTYEA